MNPFADAGGEKRMLLLANMGMITGFCHPVKRDRIILLISLDFRRDNDEQRSFFQKNGDALFRHRAVAYPAAAALTHAGIAQRVT